jgi:integrase
LKKLAAVLELPESQQDLTIYTARHSFAMAMQNQDKPVEIISQALGHQSVETTKHYLEKFSTTRMAKETDIDLSM